MRHQRPERAACAFRPTPEPTCYRFSDFGGWHGLADSGGIPVGAFPERVCLETMFCALAACCDGCGSTCGLRTNLEVRRTSYGERDIACATLCQDCAGGSLVQMLGSGGFSRAALHHSRHQLRR